MLRYAGSFHIDMIADKEWQEAFRKSALKRIELTTAATPSKEQCRKVINDLCTLQNNGDIEVASLHLPYGPFDEINPSAMDEILRKNTVSHFAEYICCFRDLHIPNVTIHCSGEPNESEPELRRRRIEQMRRSCEEMLPLLEKMKCSLNLELLPRSCIGNCAEELLAMVEGFPKEYIGILLDVNHGMDRGHEIPGMLKICGDRLTAVHISDYDNVDECHWNVGEGMLDWVAISRELKAKKQDLTVIIEVKHPAIPAHRTYKINPAFSILNIERNCMKLEYASEMQDLLERIRQSGFTG